MSVGIEMYLKTAGSLLIAGLLSNAVIAKEYNSTQGIAPEQRVKIDKTIAKSKNIKNTTEDGTETGAILSDGVTNTNCGEIALGNVEVPQKFGSKRIDVDRDIIILGDIINVSTDCNRRTKNNK